MSNIQWTDETWNPTTGCTKISPGCAHCYIETTPPFRMEGRKFVKGHIPLRMHPDRLDKPLHWRKPRRVFVNSLSDLFHEDVPGAFIQQVWLTMQRAHRERGHVFQVLTKRPERMHEFLTAHPPKGIGWYAKSGDVPFPEPGIWLGVSVEDQKRKERIDWLRRIPAAVRFLSCEPLLEELYGLNLEGIHWVIVGGESGHNARPCDLSWIRSIVAQCHGEGVPCFVKQIGSKSEEWDNEHRKPGMGPYYGNGVKDKKGGDPSEWPECLRVREFPTGSTLHPAP